METKVIHTRCCVVGGGPAGLMASYLFARAGVETVVLEKHEDFLRDFRGDTIHPSTTEVLFELGLLDAFLELNPDRLSRLGAEFGTETLNLVDFSQLPTKCRFISMIPQWDFLDFLSAAASKLSTFSLRMKTEATELIEEDERIVGVRADSPDGPIEVRADLVIAADGRASRMRESAGLRIEDIGAPIDVLWFRIPIQEGAEPGDTLFHAGPGHVVITINRTSYWQCAYVIPKGAAKEVKSGRISDFKKSVVETAPVLKAGIEELRSFDEVKMLQVRIDRLNKWSRPGLLMIGDSAHAMSPVGGVGINLAIQDAVASANLLSEKLAAGESVDADLDLVRKRRLRAAKVTQWFQVRAQNGIIDPILSEKRRNIRPPLAMRLISKVPFLQRKLGAMIGLGVQPEYVESPEATGLGG